MKILNLDVKNTKIPVVFENSKAMPIILLRLIFKVAGGCEDGVKFGLAKMAANMLNEGTLSLGSNEFARLLEMRAINLNVSAGFETISIDVNCLKEHFGYACDMLKRLLKEPNLTDEILTRCKSLTLGEIASNENDFDYIAKCGLMEVLYPKTPLAKPTIGTVKSVKNIKLADVKNFVKGHLDLANLFVVFGGDASESDAKTLCKILEVLPQGKSRLLKKFEPSKEQNIKEILKQSEQAYIYFGAPYGVEQSDRFKAKVAMFILGEGGFGSRLMEEIRVKRGLAYSAYARGVFSLSYAQIFGYMQTKNDKKDEAIAVIKDEILKFSLKGVSKAELIQAKKFLLGSLPLRLETLFKRLDIAQGEFYEDKPLGSFMSELDKISALKLDELNEFIASHAEINSLSFCVLRNEI
ncbi:MAG: insulinase family protein [Campylobacter sp.]|nr:insulinase family protein [Campylobacter sp.]